MVSYMEKSATLNLRVNPILKKDAEVDNYVVCYVIDSGIVTVTNVLYCASDIHKRLQKRYK